MALIKGRVRGGRALGGYKIDDVDVTPYPWPIFNRQQRRALNTRRALCVELAENSLLALRWEELVAG